MRYKIGAVSEITAEVPRLVSIDGTEFGVFLVDGGFVGWVNKCPHQGGPVCQGRLFKRVIEKLDESKQSLGRDHHPTDVNLVCPWHGIEFDLRSGHIRGTKELHLTPVQLDVVGDEIYATL